MIIGREEVRPSSSSYLLFPLKLGINPALLFFLALFRVSQIFGPVACVLKFSTEAEAISIANDTSYGLAAGIHSTDASQLPRVSRKLKAGTGE